MSNWTARKIAFIGICIAIALVLETVASMFFRMPQGGSISLVMVPLVLIGYYYGLGAALLSGLAVGILQGVLIPPYFVNIFQYFLDYILAFVFLGFGTLFVKRIRIRSNKELVLKLIAGIFVAYLLRLACHVLSGTLYFPEYAGEQAVIVYSLIYNLTTLLPQFIGATIISPIVLLVMKKQKPVL